MSLFLIVYDFQLFDSTFQLSELNYLGFTRRKNQREFRWNDLSKNLEIISILNGAWRLYRWDIHLVQEHLITIALKWRLHWNCFWCSFGDPLLWTSPGECPESSIVPPSTFFHSIPTFDWTEFFCELLFIWNWHQLNNLGYPWMNLVGSS